MNIHTESAEHYQRALKAGRKMHRQSLQNGTYPYLQVLDEILPEYMVAGQEELGIIDIPADKIVGTKTKGRADSFASNFMPLIPANSEFGAKWRNLCEYHLGEAGIRDPILCYEFLGRFYVQEGNKRVSVLKYFEAANIAGKVIRILPGESSLPEILAYKEFLAYYPLTKLYEVQFSRLNSFKKLQAALGYDAAHVWSEDERRNFRSGYYYFDKAYQTLCDSPLSSTVADALLEWLKVYPFERIKTMSNQELLQSLESIWPSIKAIGQENIIEVSTKTTIGEDKPFKNRRAFSMMRSYLNIAFIHELKPENSNWVRAHDLGSRYLESEMGDHVIVQRYFGVGAGEEAERAMEIAIKNGAEILFATTASLITACRRVAARHPETQILNCSVNMPYTDVQTYYSRIYEGKFVAGAIVGAISKKEDIGYIASYPIFGVTAGINAFALGAQLTNPNARIHLQWACVGDDPVRQLVEQNIEYVSTLDVPISGWNDGQWGTVRIREDGTGEMIASPYWDWGKFYLQIAQSILCGKWENSGSGKTSERALNYWWGIASGVVGLDFSENLPEGAKMLGNILREGIKNGIVDPFMRKVVSQDGVIRNDGTMTFMPEDLLQMDWLCDNVIGTIPAFEELSEKAKVITRLQGIYRDHIPPEKEYGIM